LTGWLGSHSKSIWEGSDFLGRSCSEYGSKCQLWNVWSHSLSLSLSLNCIIHFSYLQFQVISDSYWSPYQRKQIQKIQQQLAELDRKETEVKRNATLSATKYTEACQELGLKVCNCSISEYFCKIRFWVVWIRISFMLKFQGLGFSRLPAICDILIY
jgi:CDK5 regulatory subunit-associated protein 3